MLLSGSRLGATSVLLSNGRHRICVDTGMAHEEPLLVAALAKRGLAPSDIPFVINTHFHIDHVLNNSLFPQARIYASQKSYDWCRSLYSDLADDMSWEKLLLNYYPETFDYARARKLMGKLRKMGLRWWDLKRVGAPEQFVWIENHPLPEGLEGVVTSGHVPGHLSLVVRGEGEPVIVAGDAVLTRESDDQVLTMIPYNREQFQRERAAILAMPGRVLPGHDEEFENRAGPSSGDTVAPSQPNSAG